MPKILPVIVILLCCVAFCPRQASALNMSPSTPPKPRFVYKDASGKPASAEVVEKYYPKKIVQPFAKGDSHIDPKLCRAATIAEERARALALPVLALCERSARCRGRGEIPA